jgi:TatD DNase family protein
MLIDTHTHLDSFARKGVLPETLARAREAGVREMITIGTSPDEWALYHEIALVNPGAVHFTVGLHPCSVEAGWESAVAQIEGYWTREEGVKPVALGECGLDRFHLPKNDPAAAAAVFAHQRAAFIAQLEIVKRLDCPVVVHSREAFRECVELIDASGVNWSRVVFHCFTEGAAEMAELTRRGGRGSFTGIITYKTAANVREAARALGLGQMMIETDAPYLTPMPHRGKANEPAYLRHTAEYTAKEVFGVTLDEFAKATSANARAFYGI